MGLTPELGGTGTSLVAEYSYYGLDNPHAVIYNDVEYDAHKDALSNAVALTDSVQATRRSYGFGAWGDTTGGDDYLPFSGSDRARWKGALWMGPDVNIYYMRNRWYEPKTGRFLSEDPMGIANATNQYSYASDDPVNSADPTGLDDDNPCPPGFTLQSEGKDKSGNMIIKCTDPAGNTWTFDGDGNFISFMAADLGKQAELACTNEFGNLFGVALFDAALFVGIGEAAKLAKAANQAGRMGASLGARRLMSKGGRDALETALVRRMAASSTRVEAAQVSALGQTGLPLAMGDNDSFAFFPVLDLMPAYSRMYNKCWNPH